MNLIVTLPFLKIIYIYDTLKFGFNSIPYNKEYGGYELPYIIYIIGMEVLAYGSPALANILWASNSVIDGLHYFGSNLQKEQYLKPLLNGRPKIISEKIFLVG